jgi:hypothetical protein
MGSKRHGVVRDRTPLRAAGRLAGKVGYIRNIGFGWKLSRLVSDVFGMTIHAMACFAG